MIRIFIGTPANNEDLECQAVLEYTLRKYASEPLEITWMMLSRNPKSFWYSNSETCEGWKTKGWATPFTNLRWAIPRYCNFEGRAIYMDSDIIARADIAELFYQDMSDFPILSKSTNATAVLLLDCAALQTLLPPIEVIRATSSPVAMRSIIAPFIGPFQGEWNCRDGEGFTSAYDPRIKLLHYTNIPTQPNHKYARTRLNQQGRKVHWFGGDDLPHRLPDMQKLFDEMFQQAKAAGYLPMNYRVKTEFGNYGRGKADKHIEVNNA